MPDLFLELFSEEIPARMQKRAEEDLAKLMGEKLGAHGLKAAKIETFSAPRRLGLVVRDLPAKAADVNEEKKGPRIGAPDQAVQGFLKSAGLASIDQAEVVEDKKGAFYVARISRAGRASAEIAQSVIPEIIRAFPWPKSMRSGSSDLTWVRPLKNICCTFDGAEVKIEVAGVPSEAATWGHRFHAPAKIKVMGFEKYVADLRAAKVLALRDERLKLIDDAARKMCAGAGLELVEDRGLLEEVAGLSEWPVVLLGDMDPAFLDLPAEVIRLSMRTHQKYFAMRDKNGKLAPHFITVANVSAKDGGKAIAAGNARVLSARLNDARFFWETDKKLPLDDASRIEKLKKIVFHQKLGSVWDKVERVKALAVELCAVTGADADLVARAAHLMKCDLVTETVGEFPELQGQIGRQLAANENASVAAAIEDHYRPLGPNDRVPSDPVAVTLALADKLDTLVGFWAIDEKPTGSSDAYGLRRAALGFIRILASGSNRVSLRSLSQARVFPHLLQRAMQDQTYVDFLQQTHLPHDVVDSENFEALWEDEERALCVAAHSWEVTDDLLTFLADRLKVQLRDQGKRHDLVDAVFALGDDDLVRIVARVEALDAFLKSTDGANLLAGYKRAANILAAEEKKGKGLGDTSKLFIDGNLLREPAEKSLLEALQVAVPAAKAGVESEDFAAAMKALSALRAPVDAFFEGVMVNAEDASLRRNRLLLLSRLVEALSAVADFSKIEG